MLLLFLSAQVLENIYMHSKLKYGDVGTSLVTLIYLKSTFHGASCVLINK